MRGGGGGGESRRGDGNPRSYNERAGRRRNFVGRQIKSEGGRLGADKVRATWSQEPECVP